jgi:hypothetical protein
MAMFEDSDGLFYPDGLYGPGKTYDPDIHGYLIIIEADDNIEEIPEAGERGLLTFLDDDGLPPFEYVCRAIEGGQVVYEAVALLVDNDRSIVFIIPESVITDDRLRQLLEAESSLNT